MRGRDRSTSDGTARRRDGDETPERRLHPVLDLQQAAGNRAAAGLLARRVEPGEGMSMSPPGSGVAPERDIADPKSGRSMRRLKVVGLPGFTDWAIVLIPSVPPPGGKPVDILLHLHGFAPGYEGLGHTEGTQPNTDADDVDLYRIGPQMAASGRPMIGILPQGSPLADFNPDDPAKSKKQNASSKGFDADTYIAAVFNRLGEMGVWRDGAPTPGKVVLSGHSGADMPIAQMVSGEMSPAKLQALFLFDTMYPEAGFEKTIWKAIEQRLDQDAFSLSAIDASTTGGRDVAQDRMVQWVVENGFRVYNVHGSFYGTSSQYLETQRDAWLARQAHLVGKKGSRLYQAILANIRITAGGGGHWNIISADDHLETGIGMLPPTGTVARQPAPPQQAPPPRTPAQLVDDAAERVRAAVRTAAAPLVGTADGDDVVGILTQQLINRSPNTAAQLRRTNQTHPALPLYDALYGTDVVADLGVIDARSTNRKAADARRRQVFMAVLEGLVTDVRPKTAVQAPATPLDPAVQIPGERALVPRVLPFIASGRTWEDVRLGVITEFGGLAGGTRLALARADAYFGTLQRAAFRNVTTNTSVHPQLNAAFARADVLINARLADTRIPQAQRTTIADEIRTVLGRNTFSAVLRENRNAPHRLSDHSFGFAIDIDSNRNPNMGKSGALGPVEDVTGDDPTDDVTVARTAAQVESTAQDLRDTSDAYQAAMASDATLAPVLLRIANEGRAAVTPTALPALAGSAGATLVAAVVERARDPRAAAVRAALWPEGTPAPGGAGARPAAPAAPPAQIAAAERRIQRIGDAYRSSFADAARTTRVGGTSEGSPGSVAAHGFLDLPALLVGALAGSDRGNLRWLGTGTGDFMHFELMARPPLYTGGAVVDPAPPDPVHGPGAAS
ncbi:MAG TPA: hypothetical protein VL422_03575 [Miltoncostaea sp.]|nr:hypothetical protein [Miltoncostaea sp.]